jgi:hypothetical protein
MGFPPWFALGFPVPNMTTGSPQDPLCCQNSTTPCLAVPEIEISSIGNSVGPHEMEVIPFINGLKPLWHSYYRYNMDQHGTMMYKLQGSSMKSVLKRWDVRIAIPRLMANLGYHQNLGGFQLARASLSVSPRGDKFIWVWVKTLYPW